MGGASPLLALRVGAFAALAALIGGYYAWSESLWNSGLWWEVAFLSLVLMPAVFALVYLVLPLWRGRGLLLVGIALVLLTWVLQQADLDALANFGKLAAATALAFWFIRFFDSASWVALVALIIPFVDAWSVFRGPTKSIVSEHEEVFTRLSFAFPVPGEHAAARVGPPDLLFFALFLATAARFGLRVRLTWLALVASLGATIAIAVGTETSGLPALPGLSIAFLLVNADLLWRQLKTRGEPT